VLSFIIKKTLEISYIHQFQSNFPVRPKVQYSIKAWGEETYIIIYHI